MKFLLAAVFIAAIHATKRSPPATEPSHTTIVTMPTPHHALLRRLHDNHPDLFVKPSDYGTVDSENVRVKLEPLVEADRFWEAVGVADHDTRMQWCRSMVEACGVAWEEDVVVVPEDFWLTFDQRLVLWVSPLKERPIVDTAGLFNIKQSDREVSQMAAFGLELLYGERLFNSSILHMNNYGPLFHNQLLAQLFSKVISRLTSHFKTDQTSSQQLDMATISNMANITNMAVMLMSTLSSHSPKRFASFDSFKSTSIRLLLINMDFPDHKLFYPSFFANQNSIGLVEVCDDRVCDSLIVVKEGRVRVPEAVEPLKKTIKYLDREVLVMYRLPSAIGSIVTETAFFCPQRVGDFVTQWTDCDWHFAGLSSPHCNIVTADPHGNSLGFASFATASVSIKTVAAVEPRREQPRGNNVNRHLFFDSDDDDVPGEVNYDDIDLDMDEADEADDEQVSVDLFESPQPHRRRQEITEGTIDAKQRHKAVTIQLLNAINNAMSLSSKNIPVDCPLLYISMFDMFVSEPRLLWGKEDFSVYSLTIKRKHDGKQYSLVWGLPFNARSVDRPDYYVPGLGLVLLLEPSCNVIVKPYKQCDANEQSLVVNHLNGLIDKLTSQGKVYRPTTLVEIQDCLVVSHPNGPTLPNMPFVVQTLTKDVQRLHQMSRESLSLLTNTTSTNH